MSKEHLGLALSLGIPVLVVITKIDRCPSHVLEKTLKELTAILKSKSCRKIPLFVENNHDVVMTAVSIPISTWTYLPSNTFCSKTLLVRDYVPSFKFLMSQVKALISSATFSISCLH
jgi:hypothetical protein